MTDETSGTPRILGTLHAVGWPGCVRIEDTVAASPDEVWAALTDPSRIADWLGDITGDLREGGEYRGFWRVSGWDGVGRILTCDPQRRLVLSSREVDATTENRTEITVAPVGTGSTIVVEERGMPLERSRPTAPAPRCTSRTWPRISRAVASGTPPTGGARSTPGTRRCPSRTERRLVTDPLWRGRPAHR